MIRHEDISEKELRTQIHNKQITMAGNRNLFIYGKLSCGSGKRMKKENRVFFASAEQALHSGYRPCGHCMSEQYKKWKMDLFNTDPVANLLPYDGICNYYGKILDHQEARSYYEKLLPGIEWKNDEAVIFGKHIVTKRKVAWYGDGDYSYTYSNTTKKAMAWTPELAALKTLVEEKSGDRFNSCLLNLYHTGQEGMSWHSDDEKSLGHDTSIASLSFGAERKFSLKHKKIKQAISLLLENGSLLVMKGSTQTNWLHSLPKSTKIMSPRINLTFRSFQ